MIDLDELNSRLSLKLILNSDKITFRVFNNRLCHCKLTHFYFDKNLKFACGYSIKKEDFILLSLMGVIQINETNGRFEFVVPS